MPVANFAKFSDTINSMLKVYIIIICIIINTKKINKLNKQMIF